MKDRSDDPSHYGRKPLPLSYISLPKTIVAFEAVTDTKNVSIYIYITDINNTAPYT